MLWRRLLPAELDFVIQFFGEAQAQWLAQHVRIGVRRIGDTRRALSWNGGWISFPRSCFEVTERGFALRVKYPAVAGLFAHELLHALQRLAGMPVTRQSLWLQCQSLLGRCDPYAYQPCISAIHRLRRFWQAQVEQQAQMWEDAVAAAVLGKPLAQMQWVMLAVRQGRLQRQKRCSASNNE